MRTPAKPGFERRSELREPSLPSRSASWHGQRQSRRPYHQEKLHFRRRSTVTICPTPSRRRDENPCKAPGSNAGASFASSHHLREAQLGMASGNPAAPTIRKSNTFTADLSQRTASPTKPKKISPIRPISPISSPPPPSPPKRIPIPHLRPLELQSQPLRLPKPHQRLLNPC